MDNYTNPTDLARAQINSTPLNPAQTPQQPKQNTQPSLYQALSSLQQPTAQQSQAAPALQRPLGEFENPVDRANSQRYGMGSLFKALGSAGQTNQPNQGTLVADGTNTINPQKAADFRKGFGSVR